MITFGLKDGLPEERLNCLMQDRDGYIWIGARFGLYKFNGKKFSTIALPITVRNKFVNNILQDSRNRIWVCLNGSGLVLIEANEIKQILLTPENTKTSLAQFNSATINSVNKIYEIKQDLFLVLTDEGCFVFDTNYFIPFGDFIPEGVPPGFPSYTSAHISKDSLWLQTGDYLYLFNTEDWKNPTLLSKYRGIGGPVSFTSEKNLIVDLRKAVGYLSANRGYKQIDTLYPFPISNNINNLFSEGNYTWAATNEGIYLFNGTQLKMHLTPQNGLPSFLVMDLMKDNERNYWAATDRGLVLFNDTINRTFLHRDDRSSFVTQITIDSTGAVWCTLGGGHVMKIKNNVTDTVRIHPSSTLQHIPPAFGLQYLTIDHLKRIWMVYNDELLLTDYDGTIKKHFPIPPWLSSIIEDSEGNLWIITHSIDVLHENKIYPVAIKGQSSQQIRPGSIILDKHGMVWVADIEEKIGLGKIEWGSDTVTIHVSRTFSQKDGLVNMRYAKLAYDSIHDEIWAGSFWNGISRIRIRNNRLETLHFNFANGFTGERLMTIFFDTNGGLYCRSSVGLYHFTRNGDNQYAFDKYTISDGLPANEIHALCRDANGNFWVGTHEGITFFHPAPQISQLPPPKVFVEKISVNGEVENSLIGEKLQFKSDENAVSFEYYATSYRNNNRLLYSYMLEGFDKNWSGYTGQNTVNYRNLPSGDYRFKVKAKNFLGIESLQAANVVFTIATPFYKTGWFFILLAIAFLLFIVFLYRYRISQVRHEEKLKTQFVQQLSQLEIKALRSQMNPHFIFNSLNAINRYILKNEKEAASAYLTKFAKLIRLILDHSRQPKVPLSQELTALELYLQLESLRFQNNFEYAMNLENDLNPQSIFIPPMIIQPIVENAIWHGLLPKGSNCSLKIDVSTKGSNLICVIEDNGIGRTKAEEIQQQQMLRKSSVGMSTTIQRLKLLTEENHEDASITVEDLYDKFGNASGTKVNILIPFTYK